MTATKILITRQCCYWPHPSCPRSMNTGYARHEEFHDQLVRAHERAHEKASRAAPSIGAYHSGLRDLHGVP